MKTACFILSGISTLIGCITLITTSILNQFMQKLGRVAFQNAAAGSYSPSDYVMNFTFANTFAVVMIVAGLIFATLTYLKSRQLSVKDKKQYK